MSALKDLILQILGEKPVSATKKQEVNAEDNKKFKLFKFKPFNEKGDKTVSVIILRDITPSDYKKEIELLKISPKSKEMRYLKAVWNQNFPRRPLV